MPKALTYAPGRGWKFPAATVGVALFALISTAQTLSPGEVRISSRPYQPQPQVLRAESRLVRIGAVVRDGKGQVVSGLRSEDFAVYEDGKKQAISEFSIEQRLLRGPSGRAAVASSATRPNLQAQEQPPRQRYVALYFDDLDTRFGDMRHVQVAAENFIHQGVGPEEVALFTASGSGNVDFTPDAPEVLAAIEKLKFRGRAIASTGCPRITPYDAYEIATEPLPPISSRLPPGSPTYVTIVGEAVQCNCIDETNLEADCVSQQQQVVQTESKEMWNSIREMSQDTLNTVQAVVDYLAKRPGERVLVLASSGFLTGTLEDKVDAVVDNALRAGVIINALDAKGLYTEFPNQGQMDAQTVDLSNGVAKHQAENFGPAMTSTTAAMADFAVGTGGRFFHNRNDLGAGYYSLAAAPETEYLLGFAPENAKLNGAFHKLKVEVNMPEKFYVQARPGYFAPTKEAKESSQPTPEEKIDAEVRGSDERSDFPLSVSERPAIASKGGRELSVQTRVDIQKLPFELQKDRHVDLLTFVVALFDSQGKMVAGKEAQMQFALKPESFQRFSKSGINGAMSLEAPPGTYRLRVVVEEALHSEMSATSRQAQIQ
ncbi:MAG TPA: VWA domain-containing protein [Candidatus Acidoferrales bacterium]|nr:VWA domain-containing protein [Candidatus Acidoferrales bacterium]